MVMAEASRDTSGTTSATDCQSTVRSHFPESTMKKLETNKTIVLKWKLFDKALRLSHVQIRQTKAGAQAIVGYK